MKYLFLVREIEGLERLAFLPFLERNQTLEFYFYPLPFFRGKGNVGVGVWHNLFYRYFFPSTAGINNPALFLAQYRRGYNHFLYIGRSLHNLEGFGVPEHPFHRIL